MDTNEPITKYMATKLITFKPDVDIRIAIATIVKNKISGAPVLNDKGDLIGMLSEKDCIRLIVEGIYNDQPGGTGTVGDFMSTELTTLNADKTILEAAYAFTNAAFRRFPVVDNGKLVGQISRRDILTAILKIHPMKKIIPDSWKGRVPVMEPSKTGYNTKNT